MNVTQPSTRALVKVLLAHLRHHQILYLSLAIFSWALGVGWWEIERERMANIEVDGGFLVSAACRLRGYCPMFSIDVRPGLQLGNYYSLIMTGVQFVNDNPATFFGLGLILHALSAVLIFQLGAGLFGVIPGLLGGFLQSVALPVLELYRHSVPAAFSIIFITSTYLFLWRWTQGAEKARLWFVAICASIAPQIHPFAIIPLMGTIPLLAIGLRKRGSKSEIRNAAIIFALSFSPLLISISNVIWETLSASKALPGISGSESPGITTRFLGENWLAIARENALKRFQDFTSNPHANWPTDVPWPLFVLGSMGVFFGRFKNNTMSASKWALGWGVFCSVCLAQMMHAMLGYKWTPRYGFIFYPSIILLTLFGVHLVVHRVTRFRYWNHAITGIVVAFLIFICSRHRGKWYPQLIDASNDGGLRYHEQLEILENLASLGYQNIDFQSRVHGTLWHPYEVMYAYQTLRLKTTTQPTGNLHAVIIEDCKEAPEEFAQWQNTVDGTTRKSVVATYEPSLSELKIKVYRKSPCDSSECEPGSDSCPQSLCEPEIPSCWIGGSLFNTISRSQHWRGVRYILRSEDEKEESQFPAVLSEAQQQQWGHCWDSPTAEARLEATIRRPSHERTLALSHDAFITPTLFLDGTRIAPSADMAANQRVQAFGRKIARFRIPAAKPEAAPMNLLLLLQKFIPGEGSAQKEGNRWGVQYPLFIDLFEEPVPRCFKSSRP